jgi:hypothetical protein
MTRARDLANFADGTIGDVSGNLTGNVTGAINGLTPQASNMQPFNRIINGAMVIDQRNAGASVTPVNGQYLVDRFYFSPSQASKFTSQQNAGSVTPPVGFSNYLGFTVASAVTIGASDFFFFAQPIEGFNTADLQWGTVNAKTVTLSFQVYSSLTGTFGGSLRNAAYNRSYPFSYSIPVANTWTTISVTIAGDTSGTWIGSTNGVGINVAFSLGTGSTYSGTAGAWTGSNLVSTTSAVSVVGTGSATFYITGVQLEAGSTASSFAHENVGDTLRKCQRYYELIYSDAQGVMPLSYAYNPGNHFNWYSFKAEKRATPTVTKLNGTWSGGTASGFPSVGSVTFFASSAFYLSASPSVKTFEIVSEL